MLTQTLLTVVEGRKSAMAALGIAFEVQEINQPPRPSGGRPIDLVHLARQTGGDKALETEVLDCSPARPDRQ
jgi:hypothetical protein